jgi:hypothetical protein
MHNLFEAIPECRNRAGSFNGKMGFVISKLFLSLAVVGCLLWGLPARAEGDVTVCTEFALLTALEGGGLVTFDEDCTIALSGPIIITNDVTVDASGFDVTLSGSNASQLFIVQPGGSLELIGLTLSDGQATNGGALFVDADAVATVTDCTFIQNTAAGASGTNGVDGKSSSGTGANGTRGSNGGGGWGGAIFNAGDLTVETTTFSTNSATGGDGGDGGAGGAGGFQGGNGGNGGTAGIALGGAIFNSNTGTLSVRDCTFETNQASGGSGGVGGAGGAGSFSGLAGTGGAGGAGSGAGIYSLGDATIVNCTFDSNIGAGGNSQAGGTATSGNGNNGAKGGDSQGGGVFMIGVNGVVTNCTFFGNKVTGGNGGNGGSGNYTAGNGGSGGNGSGGGFYNAGGSDVVNCTFATCGAIGGTNGVAGTGAFPGSNGSPGRGRGGDVANGGGTLTIYNTILSTNSAGGNITNISGTFVDGGHNISSDASYHFTTGINIAPKIGALADNGGPTMTMALLANSPARDAGDDAAAPNFDQRNFERPLGAHSDIGAYEVGFTVSGQVFLGTNGLSGIKITAGNVSTTTDATGTYLISALGPVTITPVNTNYTFSPSSTNLNVGSDIAGVDFDATQKFSISGQVVGVSGPVSVTLGTNTITTTNGSYTFGGLDSGTFTVTPTAPGVQFSPSSLTVTVGPSTNGLNFFALFQISGSVLDGTNGLAGVTVQLDTNSVVTDVNGNYTLAGVRAGSNYVFASRSGYTFSPAQLVTVGPNATNINFTVTGLTYTISGRVTFGTNGLGGVVMTGTRTTDASGFYSLTFNRGSQTLAPKLRPYSFIPASITIDLTNDVTNVNFVAGGVISSITQSNDGIHLGVFGPSGTTRIEASTNLVNWVSIYTNSAGGFAFVDHSATNFPQRFYRTSQP